MNANHLQRVQFDLPRKLIDDIDALMPNKTRKETFEQAWLLLEWAIQEKRLGRKFGSQEKDGTFREVLMPGLR